MPLLGNGWTVSSVKFRSVGALDCVHIYKCFCFYKNVNSVLNLKQERLCHLLVLEAILLSTEMNVALLDRK
jgi:hypothetical protein